MIDPAGKALAVFGLILFLMVIIFFGMLIIDSIIYPL